MPNRSLSYKVEFDTRSAVRDLQRLTREGKRAGEDIADGFDETETAGTNALRALTRQLDTLEQTAAGTAKAAEAIGRQLGEGYDPSRIRGFVADLDRIGVTFDEIEAKAEEFAAVLKRADDVDLSGVRGELDQVGEGLEHTRASGDQSRSVLANLAGNAAQDLGELGGVVGSLGVGVGQLAEYAVDGNIALSNLAKVAGPMLALTGALALVNQASARNAEESAAAAEATNAFKDAIDELGPSAQAAAQGLTELLDTAVDPSTPTLFENLGDALGIAAEGIGELVTLADGGDGKVTDLAVALGGMGFTLEEVAAKMAAGGQTWTDFVDQIATDPRVEGASDSMRTSLENLFTAYTEAATIATNRGTFFATSLDGIRQAMVSNEEAAGNLADLWSKLLGDLADNGVIDTSAGAWNRLRDVLGLTDDELAELAQQKIDEQLQADAAAADELNAAMADAGAALDEFNASANTAEGRATAFAEGLDAINRSSDIGLAQRIIASSDALDDFAEGLAGLGDIVRENGAIDFIPDTWDEVRNMPDELRPVVEAFAGMRESIQTELGHAFETGGLAGFQTALADIRTAVTNELAAAGIEGGQALDDALRALGLDDETINILIRTTGDAQARAALDGLRGIIDNLVSAGKIDAQVAVDIATLTLTDPQAALAEAQAALEATGLDVVLPAELELDDAERAARGFTSQRRVATIDAEPGSSVARTDDAVDDVAADRTATIDTAFVQQLVQGLILGAYLDYIARPRTVSIGVEVTGLAAANQLIDHAARDRSTTIDVDANTYGLQRAIATAISNAIRLGRVAS